MRRACGTLVVLATALLSLLATGLAGSSLAGGLTTILLTVPGESRSASLTMGTPEYDQLAALVGADETPRGSTTPPPGVDESRPPGTSDPAGPTVTLSWLSHDVMVWRLDRVYLNAEGGPWISTQAYGSQAHPWAKPALWHTVAHTGQALDRLLDQLGVGLAATGPPVTGPPAAAGATAAANAAGARGAEPTAGSFGLLLAGLLGGLLGVGSTLAAVRRRAARFPGPAAETSRAPHRERD